MHRFASGLALAMGLSIWFFAGTVTLSGVAVAKDLSTYQNALEESRKNIIAENYPAAITQLNTLLSDPELPGELMALAFFYRGVAHDKKGNPHATLSDMKNALWFNVLPQPLQAQALVRQATSYARLGNRKDALAAVREARRLAPTDEQIRLAAAALEGKLPASDETASIDTNKSNVTKNQERVPLNSAAPSNDAASGAPDSNPLSGLLAAAPTNQQPAERAQFRTAIQLGALPSQAAAETEWQRITQTHGDLLANMQPSFEQASANSGLIRLRAGPTSSYRESEALCAALRKRGQDCFPVGQ